MRRLSNPRQGQTGLFPAFFAFWAVGWRASSQPGAIGSLPAPVASLLLAGSPGRRGGPGAFSLRVTVMAGQGKGSIVTRPLSATSSVTCEPSSSAMPTSGLPFAAKTMTSRVWPSHITVPANTSSATSCPVPNTARIDPSYGNPSRAICGSGNVTNPLKPVSILASTVSTWPLVPIPLLKGAQCHPLLHTELLPPHPTLPIPLNDPPPLGGTPLHAAIRCDLQDSLLYKER